MQRYHDTITGKGERAILRSLCKHTPLWITSDGLTALGLAGAVLTCLGYWLSTFHIAFLVLAISGLALNWLGDSLDGSLARHRSLERPQYGFFLDHAVDAFAMAFIAGGVGLSPLAHFSCSLMALAAYYLMVILSLTACLSTGVFRISFGGVGPTEIRIGIIIATGFGMVLPIYRFVLFGVEITIYDAMILVVTAGLVITGILHTASIARELAKIDPPRS